MSNDVSLDINPKSNPVQAVAPPKEDNNMLRATDKITALYCRLSVEDTKEKGGKDDPSNSIQHQQIMLMEYAKSQHFPNPTFFIDDGYSGVDFSNRPGFQKMLAEIEAGHVEAVITKDLSRLGRNSSLTGLYINYTFPQYGVRYIAINDHFDTIDPNSTDSDMAGIKNWFNEWYSKDTSRKIRAVNKAKGERGERLTTNVPYGYKRAEPHCLQAAGGQKNTASDPGERVSLARKHRCLHPRIHGVHGLHGQFQDLHQLHLGQEATGKSNGESQDFL